MGAEGLRVFSLSRIFFATLINRRAIRLPRVCLWRQRSVSTSPRLKHVAEIIIATRGKLVVPDLALEPAQTLDSSKAKRHIFLADRRSTDVKPVEG